MSLIAAAYGRFSTDNQKATSIDDQLRRAFAVADKHGYVVPAEFVFSDSAVSGSVGSEGRSGYAALLDVIKAGKVSAVVVDTQSRLFRDEVEAAIVKQLVIKRGVRVIAHSGLDTNTPGWEMIWSVNAMVDAKMRSDVAVLVVRGMDGALERGYMVSPPPYGYRRAPELTSAGDVVGVRFAIVPEQAEVVKRIFSARLAGQAYSAIARALIADGVATPTGVAWSVSSVVSILKNRLYSGVYAANDSPSTRSRVLAGAKVGPLARKDYLRPELALVSAADWQAVQPGAASVSRTGRGGGKHWAAGLCTCGVCGGVLSVKETDKSFGLFCGRCSKRRTLGFDVSPPYFSGDAVRAALTFALRSLLAGGHVDAFKARVMELKSGGVRVQYEAAEARLAAATRSLIRLSKAAAMIDDDDVREAMRVDMDQAAAVKREAQLDVDRLAAGLAQVSPAALDAQLAIDPRLLVPLLFTRVKGPELRTVLARLFPSIVLSRSEGYHKRAAEARVEFAYSALASMVSGTPEVSDFPPAVRVFRLLTSSRHNTPPVIQLLAGDGSVEVATDERRTCSCCGETKPSEEFGWQNRELQRRHSRCRACASAYYKAWKSKAQAAGLDSTKAWRAKASAQKNVVGPVNKSDVVAILAVAG